MGTTFDLAVAGTGAMAAYHVQRFRGLGGVRIAACYDRSRERSRAFARAHGIPEAYDSVAALLDRERLAGVSVAVADAEHFAVASQVLERDIALFVEKPLTATLSEAEALGAARGRAPVVCNFSKINYPAVFGLTHLVHRGVFGTLKRLTLSYLQSWIVDDVWGDWRHTPRWLWRISSSHGGGGALRDLGSHLFYLLVIMMGVGDVKSVTGRIDGARGVDRLGGYSCDLHDGCRVELGYPGGRSAVVDVSYARPGQINNVIVDAECTEGRAYAELAASHDTVWFERAGGARRSYRFSKVYSTYAEFLTALSHPARIARPETPTLDDGVTVQRLVHACERMIRE